MKWASAASRVTVVLAIALVSGELYARFGSRDVGNGALFQAISDAATERNRFDVLPLGETRVGSEAWFDEDPPPRDDAAPGLTTFPELDARAADPRILNVTGLNFPRVYNRAVVTQSVCENRKTSFFSRLPHRLFVFEPQAGERTPSFRFYPNARYPSGLRTNSFGYRGPEIPASRDGNVIRIAFLGASTVVGHPRAPFASPDFVVHWLNRWAREASLGVRFDYVNAARESVVVGDFTEILTREVAPLKPDLVVVWGAETFDWAPFVSLPEGVTLGRPPRTDWLSRGLARAGAESLAERSALVGMLRASLNRPFDEQGIAREPAKPAYQRKFPVDFKTRGESALDGAPPPVVATVAGLDRLIGAVRAIGAEPILIANQYAAYDGALIAADRSTRDPILDATWGGVYGYLNAGRWPLTYADQRAILEYQAYLFQRLARDRGVPFIDLLTGRTLDTGLFLDGAHMTPLGMKVTGWWMFQEMTGPIAGYLRTRQPRDTAVRDEEVRFLRQTPSALAVSAIDCSPAGAADEVPGVYPITTAAAADQDVTISPGAPVGFRTSTLPAGYAVLVPVAPAGAALAGKGWIGVKIKVTTGSVSVGVLDRSGSRFLASSVGFDADQDVQEVFLLLDDLSQLGNLVISNNLPPGKARSSGELHEVVLRQFR